MKLIFVHGWSVTNTNTYGEMPQALSNMANTFGLNLDVQHIHLGRYISFHDEVTVDDISRAMDSALRDLPGNNNGIKPFSCITHSTGGPVVRHWIDKYYGSRQLSDAPIKHLIMLAPANHGSALAVLGKARLSRIRSWFKGVEPGQKVLDWLCLGSDGQWSLNESYLRYDYVNKDFFPFVLTGQGIDHKFYDFLNDYLVEDGSDGVVRVAGANMNYRYFTLIQSSEEKIRERPIRYKLEPKGRVRVPRKVPLGVYADYSHSGTKMGIMSSPEANEMNSPVVNDILRCLQVKNAEDYQTRAQELADLTMSEQEGNPRYCMLVFNIRDDQGNRLGKDEYDLLLLAGNRYSPNVLPKGFFKDRQFNNKDGRLVYYLNAEKMNQIKDGKFGLRVTARPKAGFSYYCEAEFQSDGIKVQSILAPNEITYVDVQLHRFVDKNVMRFDSATRPPRPFKSTKPSGDTI